MDELGHPKGRKSINLTDHDARVMKTRQGFLAGLQCPGHGFTSTDGPGNVGHAGHGRAVVDEPADYARLIPMLQRAEEVTGVKTPLTLADAGYHTAAALQECADRGQQVAMPESPRGMALDHPYHKDRFIYDADSDTYRCPQGQVLSLVRGRFARKTKRECTKPSSTFAKRVQLPERASPVVSPSRSLAISPYDTALRRHRAWMATDEARRAFKKRKQLVEPVIGIIKEQQGLRRFLLRGLGNVAAEWTLLATAFNLRTLWRVWRTRRPDCPVPRGVNRAHPIVANSTANRLFYLPNPFTPIASEFAATPVSGKSICGLLRQALKPRWGVHL